jgi:SAM-dependent methyltransferase
MLIPEIDEHRKYLVDGGRVTAYARAIAECVRSGDVVVDLGSGTGILGLLACRAGARRVYSIEQTGMIEVARAICKANGFDDRVSFLNRHSLHVDLPEKADVIVTDQVGYFGFDAGAVEVLADARERFLKPGGTIIPSRIDLSVAPVERADLAARVAFWDRPTEGFDLSAARPWAVNTCYVPVFSAEQVLAAPITPLQIDVSVAVPATLRFDASFVAARAGILHGVGGWCVAQLSPSVRLSNFSGAAEFSVNRWNVFFPIDRPVDVAPGDQIRIAMQILPTDMLVSWTVEVMDGARNPPAGRSTKARFAHSTFQGMLVSREALQRTRPDFVPTLTPLGRARLAVFTLCDGRKAVQDIVDDLYRQSPGLFGSAAEAKLFVTDVIARSVQ